MDIHHKVTVWDFVKIHAKVMEAVEVYIVIVLALQEIQVGHSLAGIIVHIVVVILLTKNEII